MEIIYKISSNEVKRLKDFYDKWLEDPFVVRRYEKNVLKKNGQIAKPQIWETMISCLLSTQQRSGPESFVTKFIAAKAFPLKYTDCLNQKDCSKYIKDVISNFKGLRRANTIGKESDHNLKWLEKEGWAILLPKFEDLDQDGLLNIEEYLIETNPLLNDTDFDGLIDRIACSPAIFVAPYTP